MGCAIFLKTEPVISYTLMAETTPSAGVEFLQVGSVLPPRMLTVHLTYTTP